MRSTDIEKKEVKKLIDKSQEAMEESRNWKGDI
jgi:hypothetical protein